MTQHASDHGTSHGEGIHPAVGHVVPLPTLFAVLGALLALTVVTVGASYFNFGRFGVWIALAIAVVKASLVVLVFMHLKYDKPFNAFIVSLALVALFISIALTDTRQYEPNTIPGYAPSIKTNPS
jgi:cytochrome c oxidase subunit 4